MNENDDILEYKALISQFFNNNTINWIENGNNIYYANNNINILES